MNSPASWPDPGLVVVAPGGLAASERQSSLQRLAALLGLRLLPPGADTVHDPDGLLAAQAGLQPGWLLPLSCDPGDDLVQPGCWAEILAAWRQPVVLLVAPGAQARAYRALLQLAGVPLVGLVQDGGEWCPQQRRCDGLPWLGCLADDAASASSLRAPLLARWRGLSAARLDP